LRPLPGFRSINVTGRYWGFLALPLSLLGAAALWKTAAELRDGWRLHVCLALVALFQLVFQAETLTARWLHSAAYREVPSRGYFGNGPEVIDYVSIEDTYTQGEVISPTRGVCDCYDMDDFVRAQTEPGPDLVLRVMQDGKTIVTPSLLRAGFASWSHIHLSAECAGGSATACTVPGFARTQVILKQAYHPNWHASGCETRASLRGNLTLDCPARRLQESPVELIFRDVSSDQAAHISILAWQMWLCMVAGAGLIQCGVTRRANPAAT
jgi:hypothetical protein